MSKQGDDDVAPAYINFENEPSDSPYEEGPNSNETDLISSGQELSDGTKKEKPFGLTDIPFPVWLIITVEIFERFSFYALRSQLVLFFQEALNMEENASKALYSYFSSFAYFMPLLGSLLADAFLGRFWTIASCTVVYAIGSYLLVLAAFKKSLVFTYIALLLIAFGSGSIKPSVNVFGATSLRTENPAAVSAYFAIFYASINLGSVASTLLLPIVKKHLGFAIAFLFPAIGLTLAVLVFVSGYSRYVHIPPSSSLYKRMLDMFLGARRGKKFLVQHADSIEPEIAEKVLTSKLFRAQNLNPSQSVDPYSAPKIDGVDLSVNNSSDADQKTEGEKARQPSWLDNAKVFFRAEHVEQLHKVLDILPVFPFIIAFFFCFNQTSSTFLIQAKKMDRIVLGFEILPAQVTALNAITILILVPLFDRVIYPFLRGVLGMRLKHLNRVLFGLFLTALSFGFSAWVEYKIEYAEKHELAKVPIVWQLPQYVLVSLAELFISVCGIEFVFSQAPRAFKSTLSSFWSCTSAIGDLIAGLLFTFIKLPHLWQFSLLCSGFVVVTFITFIPVVIMFNRKTEAFYERNHKEFLQPGSTPPLPPELDTPFAPLSRAEIASQFWPRGQGAPAEYVETDQYQTAYNC